MSAADSGGRRDVALADGRRILLRPVREEDADGLRDLYDQLSADDLHRRFFSTYHPRPEFYRRMVTVGERGGARLVAVLQAANPADERIIAEAGYEPLPNGDGDLGIAVAPRWRGWLGPYLLDALIDVAAAAGVPNLEADVLVENRPMLAVLRARGSVVADHEDWSVVRILVGTARSPAVWPGAHDRPRVLVEGAGGRWSAEREARAAGLEVLTCPGPRTTGWRCPALDGQACPLAVAADAIVVCHAPDDAPWRDLLAAHARLHPGVPVCVQAGDTGVHDALGELPIVRCPFTRAPEVVSFVRHLSEAAKPAVPG